MKSEEKSIQAISAQAHSEAADNRLLRKKLQARDKRVVELEAMVSNLNRQLCEKVDQLNDMMQKLVAFMTGNGEVNLSDSLREAVVAGVRAEFEARELKLKETYASELEKLTSDFNARLAAKQNEINQLKGINDGDNPTTTMPSNSNSDSTMSPEAKLKASEQQKANLQVTAYGQHTESGKYHHGSQQTENADDLDHNGEDVPEEKIVTIAKTLKEHKDMKGVKKPRREQPLIDAAVGGNNDIVLKPTNLPADAVEIGEDVSVRHTYVKGFIRTYIIRRKKYKDSKGKCYHVNLPKEYKNCMGRTWATESLIAQILTMHFYFCDVFRRIKKTAKDKLVDLLAQDTGGEYYIDADRFDNSSSNGGNLAFSDVQFLGSGKAHNFRNNSAPVTLEKAECGYTLKPDVPTPPHIDELSEILYDHTHTNITATCIQPYNGKLYMSYHTRGKGHGGCIEVFETDNQKQTKLMQFLQDTDKSLDFNHLMVDGKSSTPNLYVVGNYGYTNKDTGKQSDAGAMMARIDLKSNGLLNTEEKNIGDAAINPLIIVPLENNLSNDEDENAIVRDGDKLLVTSTRGYEVYDPNTLELLSSKKTPGKAKHIALNNGEIATLYYNDRVSSTETPVAGTLEIFNTGADITTAKPEKSIAISEIAPNNGKNTIAIDGDNVYVCRSANGLTCYDKNTGAEKWTWQAPLTASTSKPQGYANGVTFDDKYVYLACGGYGLVVLDKNKMVDGKPAVYAKTRVTGITNEQGRIVWNSANYVTLYNGLIYVAYGKNRLKVYQLVDGGTSGSNTDYGTK